MKWLFHWVDYSVDALEKPMPPVVELQHREALNDLSAEVVVAIGGQPGGLAASLWKAMIALLSHVVSRMEAFARVLRETREQAAADLAEARAEVVDLTEELADLRATLADAERAEEHGVRSRRAQHRRGRT